MTERREEGADEDEEAMDSDPFAAEEGAEDEVPTSSPDSARPRGNKAVAALVAIVITTVSAAAIGYGFRVEHAGHPLMLAIIGFCYGGLALATLVWLHRQGLLRERLAPRRGDLAFGFLLAAALYIVATLVRKSLAPAGSDYEGWVTRIYLQLGNPLFTSTFAVGIAVLLIAAAEELVWRGLVMDSLVAAFGGPRGWLVTTALYALAHVPTVWLLADPVAGPNPMLVAAAAGCGLMWGYLAMKIERLGPSLFSHALFTWGVVEFPLWRM